MPRGGDRVASPYVNMHVPGSRADQTQKKNELLLSNLPQRGKLVVQNIYLFAVRNERRVRLVCFSCIELSLIFIAFSGRCIKKNAQLVYVYICIYFGYNLCFISPYFIPWFVLLLASSAYFCSVPSQRLCALPLPWVSPSS